MSNKEYVIEFLLSKETSSLIPYLDKNRSFIDVKENSNYKEYKYISISIRSSINVLKTLVDIKKLPNVYLHKTYLCKGNIKKIIAYNILPILQNILESDSEEETTRMYDYSSSDKE